MQHIAIQQGSKATVSKKQEPFFGKKKTPDFFSPVCVQPKLSIGAVDDPHEKEADAVAEKVMRMSDTETLQTKPSPVTVHRKCAHCEEEEQLQRKEDETETPAPQIDHAYDTGIQRKCSHCEEEERIRKKPDDKARSIQLEPTIQAPVRRKCAACENEETEIHRKETAAATPTVTPSVYRTLQSAGQPLETDTRRFMEQRFNYDFSDVRIHNDARAQGSSKDISALAYSHGSHIVFGSEQYRPETHSGKQLLAHELTHVVQQQQRFSKPADAGNHNYRDNSRKSDTQKPPGEFLPKSGMKTSSLMLPNQNTLMRSPVPGQFPVRMTDEQLIARSNQIYEQVVTSYLVSNKKEVTQGAIGSMKRELTVGVLQGVKDGQVRTMVNGNNPKYAEFFKDVLKQGELFVEPISFVPHHVRTGALRKSGFVDVHSEQVLAAEAQTQGLIYSRVATSNKGCDALCVSNLRVSYPDVTHVNPATPREGPGGTTPPAGTGGAPAQSPESPTGKPAPAPKPTGGITPGGANPAKGSEPPKLTEEVGVPVEPVVEATPGYNPSTANAIGGAFQILQSMQFAGLQQLEVDKFMDKYAELQPKIQQYLDDNNSVELILIVEKPDSPDVLCAAGAFCDQGQFIYFNDLFINSVTSLKPEDNIPVLDHPYPTISASPTHTPDRSQGGPSYSQTAWYIDTIKAKHADHHCAYAKHTLFPAKLLTLPKPAPVPTPPVKAPPPPLDPAARKALAEAPSELRMLSGNIIQDKTGHELEKKLVGNPLFIFKGRDVFGSYTPTNTRIICWSDLDKLRAEILAGIVRNNGLPSASVEMSDGGKKDPGHLQINFGKDAETPNAVHWGEALDKSFKAKDVPVPSDDIHAQISLLSPNAQSLLNEMVVTGNPRGKLKITYKWLNKFDSIIPVDLSKDEIRQLIAGLQPAGDITMEDLLKDMEKAIDAIRSGSSIASKNTTGKSGKDKGGSNGAIMDEGEGNHSVATPDLGEANIVSGEDDLEISAGDMRTLSNSDGKFDDMNFNLEINDSIVSKKIGDQVTVNLTLTLKKDGSQKFAGTLETKIIGIERLKNKHKLYSLELVVPKVVTIKKKGEIDRELWYLSYEKIK